VPHRNLKTIEAHRQSYPDMMDTTTVSAVLYRYTWASEAAEMLPAQARVELVRLLDIVSPRDLDFRADLHFQIGRTYEACRAIELAASHYMAANTYKVHLPATIRLFKMLDTATRRSENADLLRCLRMNLVAIPKDHVPTGCNLQDYASIREGT
jgi:hypothetical protein